MSESVSSQRKMLPVLVRAFIFVLLVILTVIVGVRLYAHRDTLEAEAKPGTCSGCPLSEQCGEASAHEKGK